MRKIGLLGVPSSAGGRQTGQEGAPRAFRQANFVKCLRSAGLSLTDFGDLPEVPFRPDPQHPKGQNLLRVLETATRVADEVEAIVRDNALPVVLGGDCTIALGVIAGIVRRESSLGRLPRARSFLRQTGS